MEQLFKNGHDNGNEVECSWFEVPCPGINSTIAGHDMRILKSALIHSMDYFKIRIFNTWYQLEVFS